MADSPRTSRPAWSLLLDASSILNSSPCRCSARTASVSRSSANTNAASTAVVSNSSGYWGPSTQEIIPALQSLRSVINLLRRVSFTLS